jgi:hypothetical protein
MIVNAARGGIVDEAALLAALERARSAAPPSMCSRRSRRPPIIRWSVTPTSSAPRTWAPPPRRPRRRSRSSWPSRSSPSPSAARSATPSTCRRCPATRPSAWLPGSSWPSTSAPWSGSWPGARGRASSTSSRSRSSASPPSAGSTPCTSAALVGMLRTFMDVPVNRVNAPVIAADRGLELSEIKRSKDRDLTSAWRSPPRPGDLGLRQGHPVSRRRSARAAGRADRPVPGRGHAEGPHCWRSSTRTSRASSARSAPCSASAASTSAA